MNANLIFRRLLTFLILLLPAQLWAVSALTPTRYVNAYGSKVAVYESSGTAGPGILLLHGNTSSANSYAKFMASSFAQQYRVVAIDLPGYGNSENRLIYNSGVYRNVIAEVARRTGVHNGILVGWSWGGDLALQASTALPLLKGVFIFGTAPLGGAPKGAPSPLLTAQESYAGLAVNYGVVPVLLPFMIRQYVDAFFAPNYADIPSFLYKDGYKTAGATRGLVAVVGLGLDVTHSPEVTVAKNMKIPLAMVYSTRDAFVRYEYLKALEPLLPTLWTGKTIVVPGYGHALQWESPEVFSELLQDFIGTL